MGQQVPTALQLADPREVTALLLAIIEATAAGPDVEDLAGAVARLICEATTTDVCFVHVLDDQGESLTLAGATPPFDVEVGQVRLALGAGVSGWVAVHRQPAVIVEDKLHDPRYVAFPSLRGGEYTSMASVPMVNDLAGLVGVLNVHTHTRREFTDEDVRLLTTIGNLVAGALHQARLHRRLAARERALEKFSEAVVAAQEAERGRLARDLHDGVTQRFISLTYHLDAASRAPSGHPLHEQLERARDLADLGLEEARAAIGGLRPPVLDDLGLAGGLASLAAASPQIDIRVQLSEARLPEHVEIALFRVAQQAIDNIIRHAEASEATVTFAAGRETACLEISDDGRGFDRTAVTADSPGYGLVSMAERADLVGGRLQISSCPEKGTTVTATVPLDVEAGRNAAPRRARGHRARDGGFLP